MEINQIKFEISSCNKSTDHKNQNILMICLNPQCEMNRLCCLTCIDELHQKHALISLHKFKTNLQNICNKSRLNQQKPVKQILWEHKYQLQKLLRKKQKQIQKQFQLIHEKIINLFQSFQKIFTPLTIDKFQKFIQQQLTNNKVNQLLKILETNQKIYFHNIQQSLIVTQYSQNHFIKKIEQSKIQFDLAFKLIQNSLIQINQIILSKPKQQIKNKFSLINKANCLTYNENCTNVKKEQGIGGYPIALLDQPITFLNDSINLTIVQEPGNKGIWLGVCILPIVLNNNFLNCYGLGKGAYAIDQFSAHNNTTAYSWNNHDSNFNSKANVGFQFYIDDIINIKVDFERQLVIFRKNNVSYQQPIILTQGDLYFFAGPTNIGDSISIV